MTARDPHDYIHGDVIVLPIGFMAWLEVNVDLVVIRARNQHQPDLYNLLVAIRIAALKSVTSISGKGSDIPPVPEMKVKSKVALGVEEAAARLGKTGRTVRLACATGELISDKVSNRWLIDPDDLDDYIKRTAA